MDQGVTLADDVTPSYSFSMLEMVTLENAISYTFMYRNKRFIVHISAELLEGEGGLVDTFYEFKDNLDDPDTFCDFETWAIDPIDEHIKRFVPAPNPGYRMPTTLLEYYHPETYAFELVNRNGMLEAIKHPYDPKIHGDPSPKVMIAESSTCDASSHSVSLGTQTANPCCEAGDWLLPEISIPGYRVTSGEGTIYRFVLPTVPFIPASQLARAAGPESIEEEMCEVPRIVRRVGTNQEYFFKAADVRHGFQREVEILTKIKNIAEHDPSLLTSRIVGLVNWDSNESLLMGLLLERIDGPTLDTAVRHASAADKRRWMDQIDGTVNRLHQYGLVWGDVKPDNVMVCPSGNAILVDFGGGCVPEYIDPEYQETKEGDLQGLTKMRANLLFDS